MVKCAESPLLGQAAPVFAGRVKPVSLKESAVQHAELFEPIGRLKVELEWLEQKAAAVMCVEASAG